MIAKVNALRELQAETQEELDALLPSVPGAGTKLDMHTLFLKIPEETY